MTGRGGLPDDLVAPDRRWPQDLDLVLDGTGSGGPDQFRVPSSSAVFRGVSKTETARVSSARVVISRARMSGAGGGSLPGGAV